MWVTSREVGLGATCSTFSHGHAREASELILQGWEAKNTHEVCPLTSLVEDFFHTSCNIVVPCSWTVMLTKSPGRQVSSETY